jgi:hypothetical protein
MRLHFVTDGLIYCTFGRRHRTASAALPDTCRRHGAGVSQALQQQHADDVRNPGSQTRLRALTKALPSSQPPDPDLGLEASPDRAIWLRVGSRG